MTETITIVAARVSHWINVDTCIEQFGVEVKTDGKWYHLAIDGIAFLVDTEAAAADRALAIRDRLKVRTQ